MFHTDSSTLNRQNLSSNLLNCAWCIGYVIVNNGSDFVWLSMFSLFFINDFSFNSTSQPASNLSSLMKEVINMTVSGYLNWISREFMILFLLFLRFLFSFNFEWLWGHYIKQFRQCLFLFPNPRSSSKMLRYASNFQLSSQCSEMR